MNTTLKVGLAISSFAIALSVFAHPTILQTPQEHTKPAPVEIVDASKQKILSFDFDLTKNGKSINSATASVLSGDTYKYGVTDSIAYVLSAVEKDGILEITPGTVTSGFELEMIPVLRPDGNINLAFSATQIELHSIKVVVKDGQKVQEPNTSTYATKQVVQVVKGQTFQTQIFDRENTKDKYVLTIKANI